MGLMPETPRRVRPISEWLTIHPERVEGHSPVAGLHKRAIRTALLTIQGLRDELPGGPVEMRFRKAGRQPMNRILTSR